MTESSAPALSAVMPVHNAGPFLEGSVRSLLGQTMRDFELIVLENGSSDGSRAILRRFADEDPRIRLFEDPRRLGLVESSNYVTARARAPVVARMDADDVCHPSRFERQFELMERAPDIVVVGTLSDGIDRRGRTVRPRDRWRLVRCSQVPFSHGSAMFRRDAFERIGGYRQGLLWRDLDLFLRLADHGRILVLPDALYTYRFNLGSATLACSPEEIARSTELLLRSLAERRAGRGHEHLTELPAGAPLRPETIAVALHSQGALRLWAGGRPGVLADLLKMGFTFNRTWLQTLAWAAWGEVSPRTLRLFMRGLVRAKDALASIRLEDGRAYEWRFG